MPPAAVMLTMGRGAPFDTAGTHCPSLLACEEHPHTLRWLGRAHLERAQYGPAREKFERSLAIF